VQAVGKIPVDFRQLNAAGVNALSLSAHKIGGPKGAAALVLDKRLDIEPLIAGGGHERGLRSGTENVAAIVGFGVACELAAARLAEVAPRLLALRERLESGLFSPRRDALWPGLPSACRTPLYFAFPDLDGETLVGHLDRAGYAVGQRLRPVRAPTRNRRMCCGRWVSKRSWHVARCGSAWGLPTALPRSMDFSRRCGPPCSGCSN
jgi:cysteine desulfurase